ncbi:MAG: hypothetical protein JNG90_10675 [Planctomycetaceae bacterium]|nr:hypothetical protein [Planctomycetaceae bacterium]
MGTDSKPPITHQPRWYQFRLSTWFVLVAILAWAMLYWPWVTTNVGWLPPTKKLPRNFVHPHLTQPLQRIETRSLNPRLLGPGVSLAAFAGWQGARRIVQRRRAR